MKLMLRQTPKGLEAYVPKKDLEAMVVEQEHPDLWGGWARLSNGWVFAMPSFDTPPTLPTTVEARKISGDEA